MVNVKLGSKNYAGVKAVKMNTTDGDSVLFTQKEESAGQVVSATTKVTSHNLIVSVAPVELTTATSVTEKE